MSVYQYESLHELRKEVRELTNKNEFLRGKNQSLKKQIETLERRKGSKGLRRLQKEGAKQKDVISKQTEMIQSLRSRLLASQEEQERVHLLEQEKLAISNQLEQAQNIAIEKERRIEDLAKLISCSYTLSEVHVLKEPPMEHRDDNDLKENEIIHEDVALYQRHSDIVSMWNVLTLKLQKLAEPLEEGDDDEKQPAEQEQMAFSIDELLQEYEQSHRLIHQQQRRLSRMENVFLSDLISHQNGLSV